MQEPKAKAAEGERGRRQLALDSPRETVKLVVGAVSTIHNYTKNTPTKDKRRDGGGGGKVEGIAEFNKKRGWEGKEEEERESKV